MSDLMTIERQLAILEEAMQAIAPMVCFTTVTGEAMPKTTFRDTGGCACFSCTARRALEDAGIPRRKISRKNLFVRRHRG
jgi:hypothetical protein